MPEAIPPEQHGKDRIMTTFKPARWLVLLGCSAALAAAHAANVSKEELSAEKQRIEAEYKAERKTCDAMQGNAKDVCAEQAKGKQKVARAELDYKQDASERQRSKVESAKADAQYAVAKEKCDDLNGEQKDVCVKDAKAAKARADAETKPARQSTGPSTGGN
jgi:hypothetical protein